MAVDRDDKIAAGVVGGVLAVAVIGVLLAVRWLFAGVLGILSLEDGGMGYETAFITSLVVSFVFVLAFAAVGGDGIIGEFGFMVIAYLLMVVFFTLSLAIIL